MALAGVDTSAAGGARGGEHLGGRLEPGAGEVEVVAHRVDVAAGAAEVDLPVDQDQRGPRRVELAGRRARDRGSAATVAVTGDVVCITVHTTAAPPGAATATRSNAEAPRPDTQSSAVARPIVATKARGASSCGRCPQPSTTATADPMRSATRAAIAWRSGALARADGANDRRRGAVAERRLPGKEGLRVSGEDLAASVQGLKLLARQPRERLRSRERLGEPDAAAGAQRAADERLQLRSEAADGRLVADRSHQARRCQQRRRQRDGRSATGPGDDGAPQPGSVEQRNEVGDVLLDAPRRRQRRARPVSAPLEHERPAAQLARQRGERGRPDRDAVYEHDRAGGRERPPAPVIAP